MYIAVYSVLVTLGMSVRQYKSGPWLILVMLFLVWFMGGRYYVGCDFQGYLNRFVGYQPDVSLLSTLQLNEPGFELLIGSVQALGLDYMWLNVAASIIILIGYYRFLRETYNPLMIFAVMFPIMIIQLSMSGIRQGIAVSFLLLASVYFIRGQRLWVALWIIVGGQFHSSVLAFLPIAFLAGRKIQFIRLVIGVALLAPVAAMLLGSRLDVYQARYIDQIYGDISSGGALFRYALIMIPAVLFPFYHQQIKAAFPKHYELLKLFTLISFALLPVAVFSSIALHRINYYVMPFSIVTFVYVSNFLLPSGQRSVGRLIPAVVYGVYSIGWQLMSRHADLCYFPYRNYLFEI